MIASHLYPKQSFLLYTTTGVKMDAKLNILMVTSEAYPYAKSGGLADVVPNLAQELSRLGHCVKIIMPRYYGINRELLEKHPAPLGIPLANEEIWTGLYSTHLPGTAVEVYFIEHEELYGRDGIYGDSQTPVYHDNLKRFAVLSRGAFQLCKLLQWFPHIMHGHDWTAGPAMAYLKTLEYAGPFRHCRGVFTIHNIGYQGIFPPQEFQQLGLSSSDFETRGFAYHKQICLLQAGLANADLVTTVSKGYATEVLEPKLGFGMNKLLASKGEAFRGILNGMDYSIWNPAHDQLIPFPYDSKTLSNKGLNKNLIQEEAGLPVDAKIPLIGIVSRLVTQKGFKDLVDNEGLAIRKICEFPAQVIILGTGEQWIEQALIELSRELPNLRVYIRYNEKMSHLIQAGSDFFLMPSLYEPCGLTQMYALRYGTLPIVTPTGGLKDTVVDADSNIDSATGFYIQQPLSPDTLIEGVRRAVDLYNASPQIYLEMQKRSMKQRFDWKKAAQEYADFYQKEL
jgi:starch synthase